jgi:hypothetical protein
METSDIKRLNELESKNRKLKIPASGRNHKKALVPTKARKTRAQQLQQNHSVTIAMSCAIVGLSRCAYYYQAKLLDD